MTEPENTGLDVVVEFFNNMSSLGSEVLQLWLDAMDFLTAVKKLRDPGKRERSLRAAVLTVAAAFEAFTNFLAERFLQAGKIGGRELTEFEIDCLREKRKVLHPNGRIAEDTGRHGAKARFLLLLQLVSGGPDLAAGMRAELDSCFRTRDELVHPKPGVSIKLDENGKGEKAVGGFVKCAFLLSKVCGGRDLLSTRPHSFASLAERGAVVRQD